MKHLFIVLSLLVSTQLTAETIDSEINRQHETKHQIKLESENFQQYRKLARSVGLIYGITYDRWTFENINAANKLGVAGEYEFLQFSTGRSDNVLDDFDQAEDSPLHWRTTYYKNHDITIIHSERIRRGSAPHVRLLKLAKGRVVDLHLR